MRYLAHVAGHTADSDNGGNVGGEDALNQAQLHGLLVATGHGTP